MGNVRGINHVGLTVPNIDEATRFFKEAFGAKVAYDGLSYDDEPREGAEVERQLGSLERCQNC
jgi:catechol 2,3-dioxygenase-like lactoylglutathione lyase family enzyme